MTTPQVIQISQPGKVVGGKLTLGELKMVKGKLSLKLTRKVIELGEGVELVQPQPPGVVVVLNVTADGARRHGWPHPANDAAAKPDLDKLCAIVGNQAFGQQEQLQAIHEISRLDPALGQQLALANQWLFSRG